jgi:hypothetical protein
MSLPTGSDLLAGRRHNGGQSSTHRSNDGSNVIYIQNHCKLKFLMPLSCYQISVAFQNIY